MLVFLPILCFLAVFGTVFYLAGAEGYYLPRTKKRVSIEPVTVNTEAAKAGF